MAAPSVIWDELPAVEVPPFLLNGVLSLPNLFNVVFALIPPSYVTVMCLMTFPFLSLITVVIGQVSGLNQPFY